MNIKDRPGWKLLLVAMCTVLNSSLFADGFIVIPPQPHPISRPARFGFAPLEVKYHNVSVKIDGQKATTTVSQSFYNPNNRRLEGTYIFPLPIGAHIDKFQMDVNGKFVEAELLDADKARKIYEDIVRKAKDPALLEYSGRSAFKARIFPIEPRSEKPIKITYTQILRNDAGIIEYVYPLNTEKFSSVPVKNISVKVEINADSPLKSIYCPTHKTEIKRHGDKKAVVGFEATNSRPDTDFKVVYGLSKKDIGVNLLTYRPDKNEPGYYMLMMSPGDVKQEAILPKDICFVVDTSGSMAGNKIKQLRKSLAFCLDNLKELDRFEIVRFSTEAEPFFNKVMPASEDNLERAQSFVAKMKPIGGTAIHEALQKSLHMKPAGESRPYMVIFITDGLPTIGETKEDTIVSTVSGKHGNIRIFTIGLGNNVNTHLLDRVAEKTRAVTQYIAEKEDLEIKLSNFYNKVSQPVMTGLNMNVKNGHIRLTNIHPHKLPDLFNGDQLAVFGRFEGDGPATISLSGNLRGKKQSIEVDADFPEVENKNEFIAAMWATRRVGWLLDQIRLNGESKELKDEVIDLARKHGIVTPYTAYLIIEDEEVRNVPLVQRNMSEMERDAVVFRKSKKTYDSIVKEAGSVRARSGEEAVSNAMKMQKFRKQSVGSVNDSESLELMKNVSSSDDLIGASRSYAQQVKVVNNRAFYQNGVIWNDSTAQTQKGLQVTNIKFNSDEYFELLRNNPGTAQWLALGQNVNVVVSNTLYQIRE